MKGKQSFPVIDLIGDPLECFYQLGLRDKEEAKTIISHLQGVLSTPSPQANRLIHSVARELSDQVFANGNIFDRYISAYSDGLSRNKKEIAFCMLIPELMCFMSKWIPSIPTNLLGCSSFFHFNDDQSITHARVLDFPLQGTYDRYERLVRYQMKDMPKFSSFTTAGLPYPSLTTKREDGLCLAIHQKFSDTFCKEGTSIFHYVYEILRKCESIEDIISYSKKHPTITSWNINIATADFRVLELDILGNETRSKIHQKKPGQTLYINNDLRTDIEQKSIHLPLGIDFYNEIRTRAASDKIEVYTKKKKKTDYEFIKMVATPLYHKNKKEIYLDPLTPSSVGVSSFNTHKDESYYIAGSAPKVYEGEVHFLKDLFSLKPHISIKKQAAPKYDKNFKRAYGALMQAQVAFDLKDTHGAYHNLQMAISDFKDSPLGKVSTFYFNVLQFIHDKHTKIRKELLVEFKSLEQELPDYLADHCRLFIFRLEKILKMKISVLANDFKNETLREIYELEKKLPDLFFHSFISWPMNIRIDLLDIIYPHAKLLGQIKNN
ncbi:hypothetical protein HBN50_08375 [Halobacteriovorax sp. GB3]|uniref:hypothetical protein n=1 Tax=Halobacteriovorax sp. GB3 TaxID=2719615 RepID=UPI0023606446|nr:hypothetical protein [Halobacteriovorax sp. GB3]MDD0853109.1 hypothetical protein [Halobacteriovorax sp. GB3]